MAKRKASESKRKPKQNVKSFPNIDPISFQHPGDREAIKKLDHLPGMQMLLKRVHGDYIEKMFRMLNTAERVRVTPKQCPRIYELVKEGCNTLDISEMPEIYITTVYQPNGMTFGIKKYTLILTTGLLDLLTEDELRFVIGHELSHIKCNHMMYKTLLYLLTYVGTELFGLIFKVAAITFFPLEMKLRAWERKAEFSCDRGGLLVVQSRDVAQTALVKLAGTSKSLLPSVNINEILKQADELKDMDEELFVRAMKIYHNMFRTHPFPVIRIKELHNWSQSNQYSRIIQGGYTKLK